MNITTVNGTPIVSQQHNTLITQSGVSSGFTLVEAKLRLNIPVTDASKDVAVQGALDAVIEVVEQYLDRKLLYAEETEYYYDVVQHTLLARRYPIESVVLASTPLDKTDLLKGVFHFGGSAIVHEVVIKYIGGFKVLPAGLLLGLWTVFDVVYATFGSAGSVSSSSGGAVKSLKLGELGLSFFPAASGSSSGSAHTEHLPPFAVAVFNPYRRWTA